MTPYYSDEFVTLYLGDCMEVDEWRAADVLVTDPPYGVNYESGGMSRAANPVVEKIANDNSIELRDKVLDAWGDRPAIVFGSWRLPRPDKTLNRLIWYKAANKPAFRTSAWYSADEEIYILGRGFTGEPEHNVITTHDRRDGAYGEVAKYGHPTPKPVSLMEQLIAKCPPGVIADPFAGSGSTLVAARNLARFAVGVEMEEKYCEVIANRLSQGVFHFV